VPIPLKILKVVDDPAPKSTGGRSQLASDISALLEELPPHPKWAIIQRDLTQTQAQQVRSRLKHVKSRIEYTVRSGTVYVRLRMAEPPVKAKANPTTTPNTSSPLPAPETPAAAPVPSPARPKVVGWLAKPGSVRMDMFVESWNACSGHVDRAEKVAAELDVSRATVDQWRRQAITQGRIRR
jgi:hypothetical protein